MIPIIMLKIHYQVKYNQSNLSFQTYFEEFSLEAFGINFGAMFVNIETIPLTVGQRLRF